MDDDQVKNAIKEIKSQLSSASSPAELTRLSLAAGKLSDSTTSPEVENLVKELQTDLEKRVQEAESALSSKIYTENEVRGGNDEDRDKDFDRIAAENDKIYKAFDDTHEEQLARKQIHAQNLKEVAEAIKAGNPISEDLRQRLKKSDKQEKEEREHNKKLAALSKAAKAEQEIHEAEIQKIDSAIAKSNNPQEKQALLERRSQHAKRQEIASSKMEKVGAELDVHLTHAEFIHSAKKTAKTEEHQKLLAEQEKDFHNMTAVVGKDLLLERAKEKGPGQVKSLLDFLENTETIADGLRGTLDKGQKDNGLSHTPLRPSSTPSIKAPVSNKGHGGHGI